MKVVGETFLRPKPVWIKILYNSVFHPIKMAKVQYLLKKWYKEDHQDFFILSPKRWYKKYRQIVKNKNYSNKSREYIRITEAFSENLEISAICELSKKFQDENAWEYLPFIQNLCL